MFSRKDFATNLLYLRKSHGLTRESLAKACDISAVTVQKLETCERAPSIEVFTALAEYFRVSLDELAGHTTQRPDETDALFRDFLSLSDKEREDVLRYIRFIRQDR